MPKSKAAPKSKKSKTVMSKGLRRLPQTAVLFVIAAVTLLIILLALVGYRNQEAQKRSDAALAADKATFAQIEADMATTYQGIVAAVGAPTRSSFNKFCDRPNLKFEEGDLSCNVHYSFEYSDTQFDKAKQRLNSSRQTLNEQMKLQIGPHSDSNLDEALADSVVYLGVNNNYDAECRLELQYNARDTGNQIAKLHTSSYLYRCGKVVERAVY